MSDTSDTCEEEGLIDVLLKNDVILHNIREKYKQHRPQQEDKFFFVPVAIVIETDGKCHTEICDKSYTTESELKENLKLWFNDTEDVENFTHGLYKLKTKDILTMILIKTQDENLGYIARIPLRADTSDPVLLAESAIGEFAYSIPQSPPPPVLPHVRFVGTYTIQVPGEIIKGGMSEEN